MRIYKTLTILGSGLVVAACNESLVPDYNVPTGFNHSVSALQSEMTGAFSETRVNIVFFHESMEGFARTSAYFTPSEDRFVTELTGELPLDIDNFGALVWNEEYQAIKDADSIIAVLPTLTNNGAAIPTANIKALQGSMETWKALNYMYVLLAHDTVGIAINNVGGPVSGNLAPIICARDAWRAIIAMLDSAQADFTAAGPKTVMGVPGSEFSALSIPPGFNAIGNTPGGWMNLVLALRGRSRVELAYAVANGPGGTRPTPSSAGAPDLNQLDSAITDITASNLYSPTLNAGEAVNYNDAGVFHTFSSAANDLSNPIFGIGGDDYALESAAQQIDTVNDQRFLAKFAPAAALPTNITGVASSYIYANNIGLSTPIPIIRNVELQFLLARAYLGTGSYAKAASIVDNVRTVVGGLSSGLPLAATDYVHVRDFLMKEMIPSLMGDNTGDQIAAIRDYGLILQDLTTWGAADLHTSQENIPKPERDARNNHYAPVCE
ncbi:MAG TPA: hypothetical protein VNV25_03800 [Gemmatimonadaceae bacterium]|jgi:hypothetical protein|nr:hypothetical protein [Gemmatimonadaceae bacterium]